MAKITLKVSETQTWIHPEISYTQYAPSNKRCSKHTWHQYHSVWSRNGYRCYQSGNSDTDGKYNGNQLSFMFFRKDRTGPTMREFINSIGGVGRISKIVLRVTNGHSWYSTGMQANICITPWWYPERNWGNGGIEGAYGRDSNYSDLSFTRLTQVQIPKGRRVEIDLTQWKNHFTSGESIALWAPGGYNSNYSAYGWIHGHLASADKQPELDIYYETNSAPYAPTTRIDSAKDSNGYIKPDLSFTVLNNGDPDNNIHSSTPYSYDLKNVHGETIYDHNWTSGNQYTHNLEGYRGQTIKVTGWIRDNENIRATSSTNIYINSRPRWDNLGAESNAISYTNGVVNGVFENNITIKWPVAKDAQPQHNSNLRYYVYYQKGNDAGPNGDNNSNCIGNSLTGTSLNINAANYVEKGERLYFSVWVYDGLERSSYRLVSSWIYREKPPEKPTNISPSSGHYEKEINVSWSSSSGANGTWIDHYILSLVNQNDNVIQNYKTTSNSFKCYDIDKIPRGHKFRFRVIAVDNLGNNSEPGFTANLLARNSAPTAPNLFRVDSDKLHFINSIPLKWTNSVDSDGDVIKYNAYFSINNGQYQELIRGTSATTVSHDIKGIAPGSKINYYVQAYDTFGIHSEKTYISVQPQVNIPPQGGSIVLPISDRTLYTNVPRIVFTTKEIYNNERLEVIITINNKIYRSKTDTEFFDKESYGSNESGMFVVPYDGRLNYSKRNAVTIKTFDTLDYSSAQEYNFIVDAVIATEVTNNSTIIKEQYIKDIRTMINANRFAYNETEIKWEPLMIESNKTLIYRKIIDQMIESIHLLTVSINSKAKIDRLKRVYTRDTIPNNSLIKKDLMNNIIEMIKKS